MSKKFAKEIAKLVYSDFDFFAAPTSLDSKILEYAQRADPERSQLDLAENVLDQNLPIYISALLEKEHEEREKGVCPYEILLDSKEIVGFSYPRGSDSALMKRVRLIAPEIRRALEAFRMLEPKQFELFCSRILDLLNAEETFKTQDSKDDGIDFLGWLCIPDTFVNVETAPQFRKGFRMLVIGQAKRYTPENPIGVSYIRELIGTVAAFHHDQLAPWESRLKISSFSLMSPILPLIMTTGRISRDARLLAKNCGVVTRDGSEIAKFTCLEGVGISEIEENGISKLKFDKQKFMEWLYQSKV